MGQYAGTAIWEPTIHWVELDDVGQGGFDGISNIARIQLANRTAFIASEMEKLARTPVVRNSAYTAVAWDRLWVNTSGGEVPITLPANPAEGDKVFVGDLAGTFGNYGTYCRLIGNGRKLMGLPLGDDLLLTISHFSGTLEFTGTLYGWRF